MLISAGDFPSLQQHQTPQHPPQHPGKHRKHTSGSSEQNPKAVWNQV